MLRQALLCLVLVFSLVLPASLAGASSASIQRPGDTQPLKEPFENYVTGHGLADSPWPKFRQNPQNTGKSPYIGPKVPELKWNFTTGGAVWSSPAIGADGTVYVGSYDSKLYAINPDGTEKWSFTAGEHISGSSPAIGADGTIYVGSYDGKLYAINPDGTEKWSFTTGGSISDSSPAIGADDTIYVGSHDSNLYAINPDGTEKWSFTTHRGVHSSPAIGADGTIYVGSHDGNLYAINPDGTEKWSFTTGRWVFSSPAIGADGTVYVGSYDGRLYAISPDGTEKWRFATGERISASSPAIGGDSTIYIGSHDCNLYAINPDGIRKWNFTAGDSLTESSPAIGADDTIYVGCDDGKLYAIGEAPPIPGLAISPEEATIVAGENISYTAEFTDAHGNTSDVTAETVFTIDAEAGGEWADNTYTSEFPGRWSVTGTYGELTDTATLIVDQVVIFPDANLETAIRGEIGNPAGKIYRTELEGLTSLCASESDIVILTGLEYAANLERLELEDNRISDISPLAHLTNLTSLRLGDNRISDIEALSSLASLTELSLGCNQISDIGTLSSLTDLRWLHLGNNRISDIEALSSLTGLTQLFLQDNEVSDISPLANLPNLTHLWLEGNQISDISPLANLTSLTALYLRWNDISDISPLVDNPGLGVGGKVDLRNSPLTLTSLGKYIPQLEARGVDVLYDPSPAPVIAGAIIDYFPILFFHQEEKYFPTDFFYGDQNITTNPSDYDPDEWPTVAYVHTVEGRWEGEEYLVIQYWFYYAYDFKYHPDLELVAHAHDWESVLIALQRDGAEYIPSRVTFFGHNDNRSFDWRSDMLERTGTHTHVYVTLGSHAVFPTWANWRIIGVGGYPPYSIWPFPEPAGVVDSLTYDDFDYVKYVQYTEPGWPNMFGDLAAPWKRVMFRYPEPGFEDRSWLNLVTHPQVSPLVTDADGRRVGFAPEIGDVVNEIPGAAYSGPGTEPQIIVIPDALDGDYEIRLVSTAAGTYSMTCELLTIDKVITVTASNIPVAQHADDRYRIDWEALARCEPGITIEKDYDGDGEVDEVIITGIPKMPASPSPPHGAANIPLGRALGWVGDASDSVTYDVYFGTDVAPPLVSERRAETAYTPRLRLGTKCYWRVVAINEYNISSAGPLWSFTTRSPGSGWPLIGGIIAVVIVAGLAIFLVRRRRAAQTEEELN